MRITRVSINTIGIKVRIQIHIKSIHPDHT